MKGIKSGLHFDPKKNSTSAAGEHQNGVYTSSKSDLERNGHVASICVGAVVGVAILALCGLLYYRHVRRMRRRRRRSGIEQEKARREAIRRAVRARLQELEDDHDYTPWLEETKIRTSSVTFGDVILIDPSQSAKDSPVLGHRSYYGDYILYQVDREQHPRHIYSGSKRRVHHIASGRDYSHISYHQQNQNQTLQPPLNINGDHPRDKKMSKYPNSDHPRFSLHAMVQPAAQLTTDRSAIRNIHMPNNDHHNLNKKIQPRTEHSQESRANIRNIHMPNNDHHNLSLNKKIQPRTEHSQESRANIRNIHMPNNDHHNLSLNKKIQPGTEHSQESRANIRNIHMPNNDHHNLSKKIQPGTEHSQESRANIRNIHMPNNDHHNLSLNKKIQPRTEHSQESRANIRNIHMPNNDHRNLNKKIQPRTEHSQEASVNFRNIHMPNYDHQRLSRHRRLEPATEHAREAMITSASLIHS